MVRGIEPRDDFPALPRFEELIRDKHLLISSHTLEHLDHEHYFPGPAIVRANLSRWREEGALTLGERAHAEVERLISQAPPTRLPESARSDLVNLMEAEAGRYDMDRLPSREP
jgi:trimethylamine:corrinoid methyltransferase-like protein